MKEMVFRKIKALQNALTIARLAGSAPKVVQDMYWGKFVEASLKDESAKEVAIRLQTAMEIINDLGLRKEYEDWRFEQPAATMPEPWCKVDGREKQEKIIEAALFANKTA